MQGRAVYAGEQERMEGRTAKRTARLARRARLRGQALGWAYSLCITASYLLLVSDNGALSKK